MKERKAPTERIQTQALSQNGMEKPCSLIRYAIPRQYNAIKQYQKDREKNTPGSIGAINGIAGPKTLQDMIAL